MNRREFCKMIVVGGAVPATMGQTRPSVTRQTSSAPCPEPARSKHVVNLFYFDTGEYCGFNQDLTVCVPRAREYAPFARKGRDCPMSYCSIAAELHEIEYWLCSNSPSGSPDVQIIFASYVIRPIGREDRDICIKANSDLHQATKEELLNALRHDYLDVARRAK